MKPPSNHWTDSLRRRDLLAGSAALAAATLLHPRLASADAPGPLILRPIPHSGEKLPVVGLGTAQVFDAEPQSAERAAWADVVRALAAGGGTLIDTAPSYGAAEEVIGGLLAETGLSGKMFLATKLEHYDLASGPGQLKDSLKRLRVTRVDAMQLHNVGDPEQDLGMLREWKAQGACRYFGVTTSFGGAFDAMEAVIRREKPDFVQVNYSLGDRAAEKRILPAAAEAGSAVLTDLPFGRGRLFQAVRGKPLPDWAAEFDAASWGQFFLKYLIGNPAVTAVIPGTNRAEHMIDNVGAAHGRLPDAAARAKMVAMFEEL